MKDEQLRIQVLDKLGLTNASKEVQDASLYHIESVANSRIAMAIPELLNAEQLAQVETMRGSGSSEDDILNWIEAQIPQYTDMLKALILDVTDESAANNEAIGV